MTKLRSLIFLLTSGAAAASATVLFSTDGTSTPGFFPANGALSASSVFHAFQFTVPVGQGGVLDEVIVPGLSSTAFTETVYLMSDSGGVRGSILDTVSLSVIGDSVSRLYTGAATNHVTLVAGTTYWLEAASPSGSDSFLWLEASPVVVSKEYSSASGYFTGQPMDAFALVTAQGVPEPSTWLLSASCLAALWLRRGRFVRGK